LVADGAAAQGVTNRLGNREIQWQEITSEALGMKADHVSWDTQSWQVG
jgi:hypothetical protein